MIRIFKQYQYTAKNAPNNRQAIFKFPNGYGASLIQSKWSYGGNDGLFEIAVLSWNTDDEYDIDYSTPVTDDVIGYLSKEDVIDILQQIFNLPEKQLCITEYHKALTCDAKTP